MSLRVLLLILVGGATACGSGKNPELVRSDPSAGPASAEVEPAAPSAREARAELPSPESSSDDRPVILFLGTSLSAGRGLVDPSLAFPGRFQEILDREGLAFQVVNAGVSGDTSAGGLARLEWALRTSVRVLVLELGANDGLRGQDTEAMRNNLQAIIDQTRVAYPRAEVVVAGMEAPPNFGPMYTNAFRRVFRELAEENDAVLIPFLLDGVGGIRELNQSDGIHPNVAGHRIVAATIWEYSESLLRRVASEDGADG